MKSEEDTKGMTAAESAAVAGGSAGADRRVWRYVVGVACVLTIVAWVSLLFNEHISFWTGICGLVLSCAGLRARGTVWRNLTITCIIASAVLLLVYAIFWGAIVFALNSL